MIERFKKFCFHVWPLALFGLVVSNFILSCSAYKSASPREFHYYREITNNVVSVDNVPSPSVVPVSTNSPSPVSSPLEPQKPQEYHIPYTFMVVSGAPCMRFCNRYYYEGDVMSRGRIFRIFPDRVFLQTGDVLVNSALPVDSPVSASSNRSSPPKIPQPSFQRMFSK